jgi:hypothetical protein
LPVLVDGPEEGAFLLTGDASRFDLSVDVRLGVVMSRDIMALPAFLVEPEPPPLSVLVIILDSHSGHRAYSGERKDHHADERPVAQARDAARVD